VDRASTVELTGEIGNRKQVLDNSAERTAIRQGHFRNSMEKMAEWGNHQLLNLTPDEFIHDPSVIRIVDTGSPSDVIANVARDVGVDLTILGTHEYGAVHTYLIGTTTDKLLTKISTPVLTVKL
jgi:nucleotide-binding universal stress UspA family protein